MGYLLTMLYVVGMLGAMASNYLAVTTFLRPAYGTPAGLVGLVFDAAWLAASISWIWLKNRTTLIRVMILGGAACATAIQFWIGWSEAGDLGRDVVTAGDGQNYYMAALAILRHAVMPAVGVLCVHALGRDWDAIKASMDAQEDEDRAGGKVTAADGAGNVTYEDLGRVVSLIETQTAALSDTAGSLRRIEGIVAGDRSASDLLTGIGDPAAARPGVFTPVPPAPPPVSEDDVDFIAGQKARGRPNRKAEYDELAAAGLSMDEIRERMGIQERQLRRYANGSTSSAR